MTDRSRGALLTTSVFNPALLGKDDLIRGFVARRNLLERLLDDLRRVEPENPPQHQIIIGQRGLGKTTLLRRLAFAIEDDPQLSAKWIALVFPEEQYNVKNLGDLWLNCADALSDALDRTGETTAAGHLDTQVEQMPADPHQRSKAARQVLLDETERLKRGLVLLVDNLDIVLDRLDRNEEWEFRRVISKEHRLYFIGTSSRALEALYEHGRAFYDYFHVHELKGLDDEETFALLKRLAEEAKDERVQGILRDNPARVRALRVLTGGNPRTLVLLYRVLAEGAEGDVQRDVEQLLDLYTPLYKARFEEMAPQAQQVVDAMAINWDPVTAADLAQKLAPISVNQVSAQLKRLEDFGVVEKTAGFETKKATFQIAERFFNIWYLMRASRRVRRRLVWLVKFLEAWFERDELARRASEYLSRDPNSIGLERYAEMALAYSQMVKDRHLRRSLESAGLQAALDVSVRDLVDFSDLPPELQGRKQRMEQLRDLRDRVMATRFDGVEPRELWRVLGGAPHLSLKEKARVVDELPNLGPSEVRELYAKLCEAEQQMFQILGPNSPEIAHLYKALADGEIEDVYDLDGLLSVAKQHQCWKLPLVAISSRSDMPEALGPDELLRAEKAWRNLTQEPEYEDVAWVDLGNFLQQHGLNRYEEAEGAYRKAIEIDPQNAFAINKLGYLLSGPLQRYDEAENAYRRAIEIEPRNALVWSNLGDLLEKLNRYEKAEEAYLRATEVDPQDAYCWNRLGGFLGHLNRHGEAERACRRAIEVDPHYAFAWSDLGDQLEELKRYDEAETAYRRATELNPQYAYFWNRLGGLLGHLNRHTEAERACRRAIEVDPNYAFAWDRLGDQLARLERYDEAERAYRQAIEIDPQMVFAWIDLGNLLEKHSTRYDEAERAYRRALETGPQYQFAWFHLGSLLARQPSRKAEALDAYARCLELDHGEETVRFLLPRFLPLARELGGRAEREEVLSAVSRVHQVLPDNTDVQFVLAGLLALNGQWDKAKELLERLAGADIENPDVWAFAAIVQTGHVADAISVLEQASANERWRPLYEALKAVQAGSKDYLRRVAPEVRVIAKEILSELAPELETKTKKRVK